MKLKTIIWEMTSDQQELVLGLLMKEEKRVIIELAKVRLKINAIETGDFSFLSDEVICEIAQKELPPHKWVPSPETAKH